MSFGGGGGGRGGRGGGYRGGGGRGRGGGRYNGPQLPKSLLNPCKAYTTTGNCPVGPNCRYAHVVTLHASVDATSYIQVEQQQQQQQRYDNRYNQHQQQQKKAAVSSITIWESGGIKIFTGSQDGYWRLWNTAGGNFVKEFESNMAGKVNCVDVVNNFLFCGFEAVSRALPQVTVGMVHAWNLQQPNHPPAELQIKPGILPYAHNQSVTAVAIAGTQIVSGSKDGSIRLWAYENNQFVLKQTLAGHARQVTGLVLMPKNNLLWSCSIDASIRIWDLATCECQHLITRDTPSSGANTPPSSNTSSTTITNKQQQTSPSTGVGHTHAVTDLVSFDSPGAGTFVMSSSLDGTIKAWNATTGECVASESHGEGVVTMSLASSPKHQLLLIGLESGNIMCRNLVPTGNWPAFGLLFTLTSRHQVSHSGSCNCIATGPAGTFYTGGADGKMLVFQFMGDLWRSLLNIVRA